MRTAALHLVFVCGLAACTGPPVKVIDAGAIDARPIDGAPPNDALVACNGTGEQCPASAPFCCFYCLECGSNICIAWDNSSGCDESPPPGTAATCTTVPPTGCPTERPWCCVENSGPGTWCVDHALLGDYTCAQDP